MKERCGALAAGRGISECGLQLGARSDNANLELFGVFGQHSRAVQHVELLGGVLATNGDQRLFAARVLPDEL